MIRPRRLSFILLIFFAVRAFADPNQRVHIPEDFEPTESILEEHTVPEFEASYGEAFAAETSTDPYGNALANLTLGMVTRNPAYIIKAEDLFQLSSQAPTDPREKSFAEAGTSYADRLLSGNFAVATENSQTLAPVELKRVPPPSGRFRRIILGRSAIRVTHDTLIKTQVDRVVRDWLLASNITYPPWSLAPGGWLSWHEGEKIRTLAEMTGARVVPVWGTIAKRFGDNWYAPDANGVYRFEISYDKVLNFPTTILLDDHTALINDTHGISAIAWDSEDAGLVVGCGDYKGKVDAAYYLAEKGVNVYMPTDRFNGFLVGTRTKGTIIGSGPVKKTSDGAVIGDQPLGIGVEETIVVSTAAGHYPLQYYDTPSRYFDAVQTYLGKKLRLVHVTVTQYGHAEIVVDEARKRRANVLGIRVKSKTEHDAVAAWLSESPRHRAVLFHSVVYPEGSRLFEEFPRQTTFGDVNIGLE